MHRRTIAAGWLTLRPFTTADTPWVYAVSLDPVLRRFMQVPSPYRLQDAASFVEQDYIAGEDISRRAEFVAEDAASATRLGRVGLRVGDSGAAEIGYWVDPRPQSRRRHHRGPGRLPVGRHDGGHLGRFAAPRGGAG